MTTEPTSSQTCNMADLPSDVIGIHQLFNEIVANRAVIDIRPKAEFGKLHIKNSVHQVVDLNDTTSIKFADIPSNNMICVIGGTIQEQRHIFNQTKKIYKGFKSVAKVGPDTDVKNPLLFIYNRFGILNLNKNEILRKRRYEQMALEDQQQKPENNKNENESKVEHADANLTFSFADVFEAFATQYPFLCAKSKSSYTNSLPNSSGGDEFPNIIIPQKLFLGSARDRRCLFKSNQKDNMLNITHIMHISMHDENETNFTPVKDTTELHILMDNFSDVDISKHFPTAIKFIDEAIGSANSNNNVVFVHCQMGISRSTSMVMAYLMSKEKLSLVQAYKHLLGCRPRTKPIDGFFEKLLEFERKVFNGKSTEMPTKKIRNYADSGCQIM